MKKHQIAMIVCGGLMAVLCAVAGWLLWGAFSANSEAVEERNMNYESLQRIYQAKIFPSEANIEIVREDKRDLEEWLVAASNLLHKGDLVIDKKTPPGFKQVLQETVRELSDHPGTVNGKIVEPNFYFGFDRYLGQSDSLPDHAYVDRLTFQLAVIEKICKELYAANIMELKSVVREVFDGGQETQAAGASSAARRRRRRDDRTSAPPPEQVVATGGYFTKQRFTFEFVARPAAFIDALNRLATLELFAVVAEVELHKTSDPLKAAESASARVGGMDGGVADAPVDLASVPHVQRIVTDPEIEPPVNVKLEIDVYSFDGV